jgi:protein involved in polysaccharide export with SLBB domain
MVRFKAVTILLTVVFSIHSSARLAQAQRTEQENGAFASRAYSDAKAVDSASNPDSAADLEKLSNLWKARTQSAADSDYPIGPGDVIDITVPALADIKGIYRVTSQGTLSFPYVGTMLVAGLTEDKLRAELRHRLENYVYDSTVNLSIKEYHSRQVAVLGAVQRPGYYNLLGGADTLLDVVTQAGGLRDDASQRILLIPAENRPNENLLVASSANSPADPLATSGAGDSQRGLQGQSPSRPLPDAASFAALSNGSRAIAIDAKSLTQAATPNYMNVPLRPGDLIIVPEGGEVVVSGWVERPGTVRVRPGLTVQRVVAAAGPVFAAKLRAVKILRTGSNGEKITMWANLRAIESGSEPDIPVQNGDVISVTYALVKIPPYAVFSIFKGFGVGSLPVPIPF